MLPHKRELALDLFKSAPMGEVLSTAFRSLTGVSIEQATLGLSMVEGVAVAHTHEIVRLEEAVIEKGNITLVQVVRSELGVLFVARKDYSLLKVLDSRNVAKGEVGLVFTYEHAGFDENGEFVDQDPAYHARMMGLPRLYGKASLEARVYEIAHETIVTAYDQREGHRRSFFYLD